MQITINGEAQSFDAALNVEQLLGQIGLDHRKVAVERNLEIVPKSRYGETVLGDGDKLEIVHFIGGGAPEDDDPLVIDGRKLGSRLIIGTGKYADYEQNRLALEASGAEMVTVAVITELNSTFVNFLSILIPLDVSVKTPIVAKRKRYFTGQS